MGMFDFLTCKYPLPDRELQSARFQTKGLVTDGGLFTITADGRLLSHGYRYEPLTDEEYRAVRCARRHDGSAYTEYEDFRKVRIEGSARVNYHGDMRLYPEVFGEWADYIARFHYGELL